MSRQVERFFHIRPTVAVSTGLEHPDNIRDILLSKGGATVRVVGSVDDDNNTLEGLQVQVTYCSANDAFCRKTGREWAAKKPFKVITLNDLPQVLADVAHGVLGSKVMKLSRSKRRQHPLWNQDWSFSKRYWTARKAI